MLANILPVQLHNAVNVPLEDYEGDIIRIFHIFEPMADDAEIKAFIKNMSGLGDIKAILEACLFAEAEQDRLQKLGKSILNFRGYLIAGLPKGMGKGLLKQKIFENNIVRLSMRLSRRRRQMPKKKMWRLY
jgi:hypothetical protein